LRFAADSSPCTAPKKKTLPIVRPRNPTDARKTAESLMLGCPLFQLGNLDLGGAMEDFSQKQHFRESAQQCLGKRRPIRILGARWALFLDWPRAIGNVSLSDER
jgi:hypothetical protein